MADLKATLCGDLPNCEFSPKTEQLLSLLERRGVVADVSIANEKARQAEQAMRRNMYHNTTLMLKYYRDIVWALECFPEQVAEELDRPLKDLDALSAYLEVTPPDNREAVFESLDYLVMPPVIEDYALMSDIITQKLAAAAEGTITVQEALDQAQAECEAQIKLG